MTTVVFWIEEGEGVVCVSVWKGILDRKTEMGVTYIDEEERASLFCSSNETVFPRLPLSLSPFNLLLCVCVRKVEKTPVNIAT